MVHSDTSALTSIIILTYNGLNYTRECIKSIFQYTKEHFELVVIDNGSKDGTIKFLQTLPKTNIIVNKMNKGFAGGCNQGFKASKGEFVVLLNNDTVVTKGWLSNLLRCLNQTSSAGIAGPRSNFVISPQAISSVPYQTMDEMQQFAADWSDKHSQQSFEVNNLSGFCMVFNKKLIEEIGGLDEQFNPGYYEDADFCIRAKINEKKLLVANDVFIHHYGSSSFKSNRKLRYLSIQKNTEKFLRKWNMKGLEEIPVTVEREKPFKRDRHYIPF